MSQRRSKWMITRPLLLLLLLLSVPVLFSQVNAQVSLGEIQTLTFDEPNEVIKYGAGELQFAEYWHPGSASPPLVILIHGGCWLNEYGLDHVRGLASSLKAKGYAVWSTEYRRVGDVGGGWPGTFEDIVDSINHTEKLPNIDARSKFVMGHSAGGQLALWVASKGSLPDNSEMRSRIDTAISGAIGLAAISDMVEYSRGSNSCEVITEALMGGSEDDQAGRYRFASPSLLIPSMPSILIHGESDTIVNIKQSEDYAKMSTSVELVRLPGLGHFDMIDPNGPAFNRIIDALAKLKLESQNELK
ncbi:MAG: acetyl esterase/lipase [Candidatus Azotimanducaceae bacterium]|jgi:acetyl esterase/lipase